MEPSLGPREQQRFPAGRKERVDVSHLSEGRERRVGFFASSNRKEGTNNNWTNGWALSCFHWLKEGRKIKGFGVFLPYNSLQKTSSDRKKQMKR